MASYKHDIYLMRSDSAEFDKDYQPGAKAPYAGIYRCLGCGHEISIAGGRVLPSQSHPQHTPGKGSILWQLVVFAMHNND